MRLAVIGAGVIGVTTAFELSSDGHEVTIFERRSSAAAETSFANAGVVSAGYAAPWAAPGMPGKVLRGFMRDHAAVRLDSLGGPRMWAWLWRWWRACDAHGYATRRRQLLALAQNSQQRLRSLTQSLNLDWECRRGYLVLLRDADDVQRAQPSMTTLADLGLNVKLLDEAACRAIEPGLSVATRLTAGLYWPNDDVGNCRQFTLQLLEQARARGVKLRTRHHVRTITIDGKGVRLAVDAHEAQQMASTHSRIVHPQRNHNVDTHDVETHDVDIHDGDDPRTGPAAFDASFDAVVVCAGVASATLLRGVGVRVPLLAVHGYSVTTPLRTPSDPLVEVAPRAGVMDEAFKVAISRLGDRLRVAGSAELGGVDGQLSPKPLATLYKVLDDWFPAAAHRSMATPWKGARPMLPDGPPLVGPTQHAPLWLNLGHGSSGWALACGSARLLADQISGHAPQVDAQAFWMSRYR